MDYGHIFRRLFHLFGPMVLVYYILPDPLFRIPMMAWLILTLTVILIIESIRLFTGKIFFGLREYEKGQISAYAWAGIGITIAFIFFPQIFVICAVCGMCWTDPLIGEMRRRKKMKYYPVLPFLAYFVIIFILLAIFSDIRMMTVLVLGIAGSITAMAVEKPKLPIDDDFLMLIVPLIVLTLINEYLSFAGLV